MESFFDKHWKMIDSALVGRTIEELPVLRGRYLFKYFWDTEYMTIDEVPDEYMDIPISAVFKNDKGIKLLLIGDEFCDE